MKSCRFLSCLEADDIEKKINELTKYLVRAMSSHSYYLISIIVYIFSKLKLSDGAIQQFASKFVDTVNAFVLEFAEKKEVTARVCSTTCTSPTSCIICWDFSSITLTIIVPISGGGEE